MKRLLLIIFALFLCSALHGQENSKDISLNSEFIINMISEVTWPAESKGDTFIINVIGNDDYVPALKSLAASGSYKDKDFVINFVPLNGKIDDCQMIIIATDSLSHLAKILKNVAKKPILTVSMSGTFARYGVMVNIHEIKNDEIRYAVNKMTARKSKITISDKFLKNAIRTF